jgi:hypothetical protein
MKTKIIFVALMMLSISTTFANDTLRSVEVVLSQDKSLISEIAITEISQKGRMTIVYDTLQKLNILEDAKPWITQDLAQKLMEVNNDPNLYGKHIWLPDLQIYPTWTQLFISKYWEVPHKLGISDSDVVYSVENHLGIEKTSNLAMKNIIIFVFISLVVLVITLLLLIKNYNIKYGILILSIFLFLCILITSKFWDSLLFNTVVFCPSILTSFLFFQTRLRKGKLEKHGWQVEKPLKVFENGDVFLKRNICGKLHYIGLFDKKYRMKKQQPYDTIDETKFGSYIIRNFEDLYGLVDENLNEILEIKYSHIFKLEESNFIEVREEKEIEGRTFCTCTNKFIDTEGNPVSD